jgi:hypothetical protein
LFWPVHDLPIGLRSTHRKDATWLPPAAQVLER